MDSYIRPGNLNEALNSLSENPRIILAGGIDFFPSRVAQPLTEKST